jgi:OOP family OmpA-OmpF porin
MYKKALTALAVIVSSGFAQAQAADARPGWYAGLDLGVGRAGVSGSDVDGALANQGVAGSADIDNSGTAFGINGGYRLNRNFAVEAAAERLGSFDYNSTAGADTINGKYEANALSLAGVGFYPLSSSAWSLYGKAGLALTQAKLGASSGSGLTAVSGTSHTGTGLLVGAGVTYDFDPAVFAKAGWDHYAHVGDPSTATGNIDTYMLGVGMRF